MSKVNELGLIRYAIFTSLTRNLKNLWVDFYQTWYRGAPPGVDELIRFWASSTQRQYARGAPPRVDELNLKKNSQKPAAQNIYPPKMSQQMLMGGGGGGYHPKAIRVTIMMSMVK